MSNSEGKIEKRRRLVGELWLKGNSIRAITAELRKMPEFAKLNKSTVNKDLLAIKARLVAENTGEINGMRARSVGVLRKVQAEAWEVVEKYPGSFKEKAGYLRIIADCEEKIAKLQGTFAPVATQVIGDKERPLEVKVIKIVEV
jgi:predicted nuclease with RNAse H fold